MAIDRRKIDIALSIPSFIEIRSKIFVLCFLVALIFNTCYIYIYICILKKKANGRRKSRSRSERELSVKSV